MNRDQTIANLVLHGYVPYANMHNWVAVWSAELEQVRMCKFFEDGMNGPGWDVRDMISDLALIGYFEVPWHRIDDGCLAQLTAKTLPPKYMHDFTNAHVFANKGDTNDQFSLGGFDDHP